MRAQLAYQSVPKIDIFSFPKHLPEVSIRKGLKGCDFQFEEVVLIWV